MATSLDFTRVALQKECKVYLTACTLLALTLVANAQETRAKSLEDLEPRWTRAMRQLRVPGMAVAVVRGGRVLYRQCFGIRDLGENKPVTPDTAFYIASCTKSFVATAIAMLAEQKKLDLDAPVKSYLPRFRIADPELSQKLTVRDLLCHRYGLHSGPIVFLDAYSGEITEDRFYGFLAQVEPADTPRYSNLHFTLAGRVIAQVTGYTWRDFLEECIFRPAGMQQATGYADGMYARDDVAIPLLPRGESFVRSPVRKTDRTMHAAGGLGMSIRDLERWLLLNLGGGKVGGTRIIGAKALAELHRQHAAAATSTGRIGVRDGFGLGWFTGKYRGRRWVQHGGGYVGAAAHVSFLPDEGIGVALLANTNGSGHALIECVSIDIYDHLLGIDGEDLLPDFARQSERFVARLWERPRAQNPARAGTLTLPAAHYTGIYRNPDWGTVLIQLADGNLVGRIGGLEAELFARGKDRFGAIIATTQKSRGRFDIAGGKVRALVLDLMGRSGIRFVRDGSK